MTVSPDDRAKWDRQVAALREEENDDEGTPEWRWAMIESLNRERLRSGHAELKTEGEVHRRARAIGLLGRVP